MAGEKADLQASAEHGRTWVVGTAGHVDHGKSTLVHALTGIHPDRLQQEREREMTIDLGFAWLQLPGGLTVSVIDVPGHERFIKNMLAGVGGIDAAMLVIAADEGPMPQTAEHLAILDLLGIQHGVVVLTKADLVDADWLELITEETRERLAVTTLAAAPIVPVSSTTGTGLDELRTTLAALLQAMPERAHGSRPRLPIDRAFTVTGFGTVVTGTLLDGPVRIGQELELLPQRLRTRIRGIQSHGHKVDVGYPGARTALNLTGVDREDIQRGNVLTVPGTLEPTTMLDVRLRSIADAGVVLEQNAALDVFVGAAETLAHMTLLDSERLIPGEEQWVQLRLAQPIAARSGDQLIVRLPSPSRTIGGGTIVDAHPRRHRRFRQEVIEGLETRAEGTPLERLLDLLDEKPWEISALAEQFDDLRAVLSEGTHCGEAVALGSRMVASKHWLAAQRDRAHQLLTDFHARQPLRRGMPKEDVKSRLGWSGRLGDAVVQHFAEEGTLVEAGGTLSLPEHRIKLEPAQRAAADRFLAAMDANPYAPPAADGFGVTPDVLAAMAELGEIVRLPDHVTFTVAALDEIKAQTLAIIAAEGSITLARFRDHFNSSRKYAQAVLEYFDQQRITRRVGDNRVKGTA